MMGRRDPVSGLESIVDLLQKDLLDGRRDDLAPVGLKVLVPNEVDLHAALHCRARHFINITAKAHEEVEWHNHGEVTIQKTGHLIKRKKSPRGRSRGR